VHVVSLEPLLKAAPAIQVHAYAAFAAFGLGAVQLLAPKGTISHRVMGWAWVALMAVIAGSSLLIHEIRLVGPWSPIHLLSLQVLTTLPFAVLAARRGDVERHRRYMSRMFLGALAVAGLFTLLPGRIMHQVLFGG
jgi:uncharacterized membrane protein